MNANDKAENKRVKTCYRMIGYLHFECNMARGRIIKELNRYFRKSTIYSAEYLFIRKKGEMK